MYIKTRALQHRAIVPCKIFIVIQNQDFPGNRPALLTDQTLDAFRQYGCINRFRNKCVCPGIRQGIAVSEIIPASDANERWFQGILAPSLSIERRGHLGNCVLSGHHKGHSRRPVEREGGDRLARYRKTVV